MNIPLFFEITRQFVFSQLFPTTIRLVLLGCVLFLVAALLSPFESLGWWAGWFGHPQEQEKESAITQEDGEEEATSYIVYLSGIGDISGESHDPKEVDFLHDLGMRLPHVVIVKDIFPYAMNNRGLTSQRLFARLWRWIVRRKLSGKLLLSNLINIRNLLQVAVSADRRYGPIYNYGIAEVIRDSLLHHNYRIGSGKTVTLIGYSGGAQIAVGAAIYLKMLLKAPLQIIAVGGVFADDPGFASIDHFYRLHSRHDPFQRLGAILYAGRWSLLRYSPWNKAKAAGHVTTILLPSMRHTGRGGYFDAQSYLADGKSHQQRIAEICAELILRNAGNREGTVIHAGNEM